MSRRKAVVVGMAGVVLGGLWAAQALSQQPREGQRREGDRRQRMEEFRRRMQERMRERLGATEAEWKVLQPRIEKVQQLQRATRGGFRIGMGGRRGGRRPGGEAQREGDAPQREQSEIEKKSEALRNLLDDQNSAAQAIKAALDALRRAREEAQQDLAAARKELRGVVTVRQEAQLVLMGLLE